MRFEQQTALKIREKIVDFFEQSELRKRSNDESIEESIPFWAFQKKLSLYRYIVFIIDFVVNMNQMLNDRLLKGPLIF